MPKKDGLLQRPDDKDHKAKLAKIELKINDKHNERKAYVDFLRQQRRTLN